MGRPQPAHLIVGFVNRPHGVKGEVVVHSLTDHPEGIYSPGVVLLPADADGTAPDPDRPPLRIESARPFRSGFLVLFGGMRDRTDADSLRGQYLMAEVGALAPLKEGEVFHHQLVGLEVDTDRGAIYIPFREEIVVQVDLEAGQVVIDPPEGLLELNQ